MSTQGRGHLTKQMKDTWLIFFDEELTLRKLRLLPYINSAMLNDQRLDPNRINEQERKIVMDWKSKGLMTGGATGLSITEDFWKAMCKVLWLGYMDYSSEE